MTTDQTTIEVKLTLPEVMVAAIVGVMRRLQDLRAERHDRYGLESKHNAWQIDIEGACAEMSVAKWLGVYWAGALGNLRANDAGPLQVRSSSRANARLIVHPADADDRVFVLVIGSAPWYRLTGWILARDAKAEKFWTDPGTKRPAYFVPQASLRPMSEVKTGQR